MRKFLIACAVLVVALVAADRIAVALAQDRISSQIAAAYGLPSRPGVTIEGFPFLTQVLTGNYQQIEVSASRVQADGETLRDLRVRFTGVHASLSQMLGSGPTKVTARNASGSAMLAFSLLRRRLPRGLRVRPDGGDLKLSGRMDVQGGRVPVSATLALRVTGTGIEVTPVSASTPGVAGVTPSAFEPRLGVVVPLSTLPLHLRLSSVRVTTGGVQIGASASDVHFARG
jgi:DUF2993 family protein